MKRLVLSGTLLFAAAFSLFFVLNAYAQSATLTAPTGVAASITSASQVAVSWGAASSSIGISGYYVYRNGAQVANTAGLSFTDFIPSEGVYTYTVAAYDLDGNVSALSFPSSPITITFDRTPPTAPSNLIADAATSTVALSWTAATDNVGVTGYYVYRNDVQIEMSGPLTGTSYSDTGLAPNQTYIYSVEAYDAAGNISPSSNSVRITTVAQVAPPSMPTGLNAEAISASQVNLTWQAAYANAAIAGYYIYENGNEIATITGTSTAYSVTGLSGQTTYTFNVAEYDVQSNVSPESTTVSVETPIADTTPPTIPSNVQAFTLSGSSVRVSWYPSSDNVAVAGYIVYCNGGQVATTSAATFSYVDTGLATSTLYSYTVAAYDQSGNVSVQSFPAVAMTLATNPAMPTPTPAATATTTTSATPPIVISPPVIVLPVPAPTSTMTSGSNTTVSGSAAPILVNLLFGSHGASVNLLQEFLISQGYLGANYATGFYGVLTQSAVEKFQCVENIICFGDPTTTGWGKVGPKTRRILNQLNDEAQ